MPDFQTTKFATQILKGGLSDKLISKSKFFKALHQEFEFPSLSHAPIVALSLICITEKLFLKLLAKNFKCETL